jgi:hypothetical protein
MWLWAFARLDATVHCRACEIVCTAQLWTLLDPKALALAQGIAFRHIAQLDRANQCASLNFFHYGCSTPKLDERSLRLHLKLLEFGRPRELRPTSNSVWFLQTDASYEPSSDRIFSGIGAVLFDPTGRPVQFFSKQLTCDMVQSLNPSGKKNAIFECEFFALFRAFYVWGDVISNALVIYTDHTLSGMGSPGYPRIQIWPMGHQG